MSWKGIPIFFLAAGVVTGALRAEPTLLPPRIDFSEASFNAGTVWEGERVPHTFTFRNDGGSPLEITRVKTSCGCTAAKGSKDSLAPGEEGTIQVEFNTNRRHGFQSKHIYVQSNDPETPLFKLTISCYVKTAASFKPRALFFNNVTKGATPEEVLRLEVSDRPLLITGVEGKGDFFEVILPREKWEVGPETSSIEIPVRILATAPLGKLSGEVVITTDHPQLPWISARVRADIRGLVEYSPRMCFFNRDDLVHKKGKIITVSKRGESDLKITDPRITIKGFDLKLAEIRPGQEYSLAVTPVGTPVEGRQRGVISFLTNQADQAKVEIPVSSYMPAP